MMKIVVKDHPCYGFYQNRVLRVINECDSVNLSLSLSLSEALRAVLVPRSPRGRDSLLPVL